MPASRTYAGRGGDLKRVASVASFFISRIDTEIDTLTAARLKAETNANQTSTLRGLTGKIRDCQRQVDLPTVSGALQRSTLAGLG